MNLFRLLLTGFAFAVSVFTVRADAPSLSDVVYGTAGDQKLKLDVWYPAGYKPDAGAKKPAVLCIHGGAWRAGNKRDMAPVAAALTSQGFVTFSAGYRLFDPEKFPQNVWPAQIDDVQRAVRWIRKHADRFGVDPQKLGAIGISAGGHLVALLGTTDTRDNSDAALAGFSSRVNAVVDVVGPADFRKDFSHLKLTATMTVQEAIDDFLGTKKLTGKDRDKIVEAASPLLQAGKKSAPIYVVHGALDHLVPVEQGKDFAAALKKAGGVSELLVFPDEGHGFGKPENVERFRKETLRFFTQHLGSPEPKK